MEEFTPREIAKCLRLLRCAKEWTLRKIEKKSGVDASTFVFYTTERRRPSTAQVERLLVAMGCTWETLDLARALLREVGAVRPDTQPVGGGAGDEGTAGPAAAADETTNCAGFQK